MFHSTYTDLMLNVSGVNAETKDRVFYILRLLGLGEQYSIRQKRQAMLTGLDRLWSAAQKTSNKSKADSSTYSKEFVVAIPWKPAGMNSLVPTMLGTSSLKFSAKAEDLSDAEMFYSFGIGRGAGNIAVEKACLAARKPLIRFEYGFISSLGLAINNSFQHSIILCPGSMYYDAKNESAMERDLNSESFYLNDEKIKRVKGIIKTITEKKITKYNHAPDVPVSKFITVSSRKKILLVDQRFGDASIVMGLANEDAFRRMWEEALRYTDHDIIVKLHPDAVSGGKESSLSKIIPKVLPKNVFILSEDINPFNVISEVDKVFVCVSQLGFEALMLGKEVHCFGVAFYSGWGLTTDYIQPIRKRKKRSLEELFYIFYIEYSRYAIAEDERCELENLLVYLENNRNKESRDSPASVASPVVLTDQPKILMIIPSGRFGATGRYFQVLALEMKKLGAQVIVLAEAYEDKVYEGVTWLKLEFEGMRLSKVLRGKIQDFAPDIIYENGVRTRAQRAALEILYLTNAKLALQSEDDDVQVYKTRHPSASDELIQVLDKPSLSHKDILKFIKMNDWMHTARVLMDPDYDRWVDPLLRSLCYHCSSLNTAIWYPFSRRLKAEYSAPTMVVPPVADMRELSDQRLKPFYDSKLDNVKEGNIVLFLGGTIYDYSPEFELFLQALNLLCEQHGKYNISLIVVSGRTKLDVSGLARKTLDQRIQFLDLGAPDDKEYMKYLVLSDVICSPGLPDRFNLYRLPSRLVKAMLIGKPVLTTKIGFGESLKHGKEAILISGDNPDEWAEAMSMIFDREALRCIGEGGKVFAVKNFDAKKVANSLISNFKKVLQ